MASGNSVSVSYQDGREVVTVNGRPIPGATVEWVDDGPGEVELVFISIPATQLNINRAGRKPATRRIALEDGE